MTCACYHTGVLTMALPPGSWQQLLKFGVVHQLINSFMRIPVRVEHPVKNMFRTGVQLELTGWWAVTRIFPICRDIPTMPIFHTVSRHEILNQVSQEEIKK